jgi:hypothetical protein
MVGSYWRLWELREQGVQLRNRGKTTREADSWKEDFENWHAKVLKQATEFSMDLRHSLDPIDKIDSTNNENVSVPDQRHQKEVSVTSEILARLYKYLNETAIR